MHDHYPFICVFFSVLLLAVGCSEDSSPDSRAAALTAAPEPVVAAGAIKVTHGADRIDWFGGGVEAAFVQAKAEGKPIFLYWGAEWCPPCHLVKATVFRSPEFIARSKLFVPVYLDGDNEDAQRLGEDFGVLGYPTMIVFSSAGDEITRIPGGSDIQAYANVLDLTLSNTAAASTLVARVLNSGGELSGNDCRLLAYYSWGQDTAILQDVDKAHAFRRMHDACPASERQARSVLFMSYLSEAIARAEDPDEPVPLSSEQRDEALARVVEVLADPGLMKVNMYSLLFDGASITAALTAPDDPARERLVQYWQNVLDIIAADESVFQTERLYTKYGKIRFERINNAEQPLSDALRDEILAAVRWADEATPDVYERQSVMNTASGVLVAAGLTAQASELLHKELGISKQPYYFMVSLAEIEQEAGNYAGAIGWFKRAYDEATGPATRFQWGSYYVTGLIEMVPEETAMIEEAALALIAELGESRAFYQRPKRQLERLEKTLRDWSEAGERGASIESIRTGVRAVCSKIPREESSRQTCDSFLAT